MTFFKKLALAVLTLFMLTFLFSCGSYNPALNSDSDSQSGSGAVQPDMDDDPTNDFTASLRLNGQPYTPLVNINVYWRDGYNIHIAPVDESGVARIDGLDGDYQVTLSNVPHGYAYDPNAYKATNDQRNVTIDLYDLNVITGGGDGLYESYRMNSTGIYSVTVDQAGDRTYFEFAPQINGTYTVESLVDVHDDGVNPICMAYYGSSSYKYGEHTVTDVGACGSYTRNFIHTVEIADENISSGGGQVTFSFAITAEPKSGVYPVTISFAIKRNGDFDLGGRHKTYMVPQADLSHFDFTAFDSLAGRTIIGAETLYPGTTDSYMFDEDNYKIWKISDGGDGVYHVYDPDLYPSTNGYGPVLVAYISQPCRFLDAAFTAIEAIGNKALTVNGTENYKQFIEGFDAVANIAAGGYYCSTNCPCHNASDPHWACLEGCATCKNTCIPCPAELMGKEGYADWCNADGVVPVTEELAEFLQKFAISQRYFADGDGWVETNSRKSIDAYEDSQWLFACGYYI